MLKRLFTKESVTLLGRWEHRLPEEQKNIKFLYNNLDHCGDKICGDMSKYKNNKEIKEQGSREVSHELFSD